MGDKLTKHSVDNIHPENVQTYPNIVRAYAKWDHHVGLTSHDIPHCCSQEIKNLNKSNQLAQNSFDKKKQNLLNIKKQSNCSSIKEHHSNENIHREKLKLKRSHSFDNQSNLKNLITAEQLIRSQSERHKSLLNKNKSTSQFNLSNNVIKQIPLDLQLVLINQHDLQNISEVGKGNFGTVYRALYKNTRDVALKTLKPRRLNIPNTIKLSIEEYDNNMYELLHEAHIMTCLQHKNLLRIIGVTFIGKENQLCLVTDFMKNGSLLDYLRKYRNTFIKSNPKDVTNRLNSFSKQIFQAMLYLEERGIIHRDLAARNCLIGEKNTLKVADFGLTKLTDQGLYKGNDRTICAIRWTSPEGIFSSKYTSRSDVWSYGITLWEIYSLGERPFGDLTNFAIKNILKNSTENLSRYLPQSNQFASDILYSHIILPCLTYNVALRPRFCDLNERIYNIFNDNIQ